MNELDRVLNPNCTVLERAIILRALFLYGGDLREGREESQFTGVTTQHIIELCEELTGEEL